MAQIISPGILLSSRKEIELIEYCLKDITWIKDENSIEHKLREELLELIQRYLIFTPKEV